MNAPIAKHDLYWGPPPEPEVWELNEFAFRSEAAYAIWHLAGPLHFVDSLPASPTFEECIAAMKWRGSVELEIARHELARAA